MERRERKKKKKKKKASLRKVGVKVILLLSGTTAGSWPQQHWIRDDFKHGDAAGKTHSDKDANAQHSLGPACTESAPAGESPLQKLLQFGTNLIDTQTLGKAELAHAHGTGQWRLYRLKGQQSDRGMTNGVKKSTV